ncbi:MAG: hypothetical protein LBM69_07645, partial [Lachnospiraceae bacterium]|nr:hypothetical protein [Lachnospiraceae bacterium]
SLSFEAGAKEVTLLKECFFDQSGNRLISILFDEDTDVDSEPNYQCFSYHFDSQERADYNESVIQSANDIIYWNEVAGQLMVIGQSKEKTRNNWSISTFSIEMQKTINIFTASDNDLALCPKGYEYIRTACFSPDGRYMAIGEDSGNIFIFDIEEQKIVGVKETNTQNISILHFIDDTCLYASFPSSDADSIMIYLNMESGSLIQQEDYNRTKMMINEMALENTIGEARCTTSPTQNAAAIVNSNGEIYLFSLKDALIEESTTDSNRIIANLNDQFPQTISNEGDSDEITVLADSDKYRFEVRQKVAQSTDGTTNTDSQEVSYWMVNKTNEVESYEVELPFMALACDIKDDKQLTLLSEGYLLHDIDLEKGEITKTIKIKTDFNNSGILSSSNQSHTKFAIDYENENPVAIIVKKYINSQGFWKNRGIVVDYTTGEVLFEFSDAMRYMELGFDSKGFELYKIAPNQKGLIVTIPTYDDLIKLAQKQIAGEW